MLNRIMVPLDGSEFAEFALPTAVALARRAGSTTLDLVLVHEPLVPTVAADGVPVPAGDFDAELRKQHEEYLRLTTQRVRSRSGITVTASILEGVAATALAAHAETSDADLVVMTSHGRGGLSRAWLGSVTDVLLRHVHVPVLVARPPEETVQHDEGPLFQRVLVPLDGSGLGEATLERAMDLVGTSGVEFTLARVVTPLLAMLRPPFPAEVDVEWGGDGADVVAAQAQADEYLESVAARLRARGVMVQTVVLIHEHAARAILRYAAQMESELIVMATHGRGPMGRLVLGSTTDKVLRAAALPVLVQHPSLSGGPRQHTVHEAHAAV